MIALDALPPFPAAPRAGKAGAPRQSGYMPLNSGTYRTARALLSVPEVSLFTDLAERQILTAIETGKIQFCFDVAGPEAGRRRELRILLASLKRFMESPGHEHAKETETDFRSAVFSALPPPINEFGQPVLRAISLTIRWGLSPSHVLKLVHAGCLKLASVRVATKASPYVSFDSAVKFLHSRRL